MQEIGNNSLLASVIDETVSAEHAEQYRLLAQVNHHHIIFSLFDKSREKFIALEKFLIQTDESEGDLVDGLNEIYTHKSSRILNCGFSDSFVGVFSDDVMHIPAAMFDEQQAESIHQLQSRYNGRKVLQQKFLSQDIRSLYTINPLIEQTLRHIQSDIHVLNSNALYADSLLHTYKHDQSVRVHANIIGDRFDLVISQGSKLLLSNHFAFKGGEDFMFYSLTALEQLDLNPDEIPFHVSGEIARNSGLFIMARKYIRHFDFMNRPDHCEYAYGFDNLPSHAYVGLYNMLLCVS
ncbi:MAG TPA: DUF3822 family protein [Bacteroidia bacterium]|nr:DUF3822 family protein [Bacteroidia bacterium]HNT79788.1 DUF3822 family protein [Bacteroidia bacterium]